MARVVRAPQGAVVLPDLDRDLDDAAWTMLGDPTGNAVGVAGHPQAILYRLLEIVGVGRDAVRSLGEADAALGARARFLSQALRAGPTRRRLAPRRADDELAEAAIETALAGIAIVPAADENEEAWRWPARCARRSKAWPHPQRWSLRCRRRATRRRGTRALGHRGRPSAGRPLGEMQAGVFARLALAAARDFALPRSPLCSATA